MDQQLLDRLRERFAGRPEVVEKRMVGGRSFSTGDRMFCGVNKHGLMIRVHPDDLAEILRRPGASQLRFGARDVLGFVVVDTAELVDDAALDAWIDRGLDGLAKVDSG